MIGPNHIQKLTELWTQRTYLIIVQRKMKMVTPPFYESLRQLKERGIRKTLTFLLINLSPSFGRKVKYISFKFFSRNKCVVLDVNGFKMWINIRDKGIHRQLFLYGKREPFCTDYLMNSGVLKEGDVVLDIGANMGYYVLIESNLVGDLGKVYAIEPVSSTIKALKRNIKLNNCENVEIFRVAVGDKGGKSSVYISDRSNLSAMERILTAGNIIGVEEVDVLTVDSFLEDKNIPDLIRMDVEGYEYNIVRGMTKTLQENTKILMELHPHKLSKEQMEEMFEILKANNFKVKFAVYDHAVKENMILQSLMQKLGDELPLIFLDMTIDELSDLVQTVRIQDLPAICPHVLFSKDEDAS